MASGTINKPAVYFKSGDSFSTSYSYLLSGIVTSDAKEMALDFTLPYPMLGVSSVSASSFKGNVRGVGGYVDGSSNPEWTSGYTFTITILSDNRLRFDITKSTAFSNATNNTPVAFWGNFTISFS